MNTRVVHFIGVGGIGVSALARYFLSQGWQVSGSDLARSEIVDELASAGALIFIGHRPTNVPKDVDTVIYSPAVKRNNPELKIARQLGAKIQSYPEALGELTKKYFTIAVSGSHGKSTVTALIGLILAKAGLDPTVIIGTKLREFGNSNFRAGKSKYLVIEADEWNRSFHNYFPKIAVLTNIDKEHLDTYKTFRGVAAGFARYLKNLFKDGVAIFNWGDRELRRLGQRIAKRRTGSAIFYNKSKFKKHPLQIPGRHNQVNAEAAWQTFGVIAKNANLKQNNANLRKIANDVFRNYHGAWRRLEKLPITNYQLPITAIYTDYAHHPTEIKATLQALREKYPKERIACVFEPHQQDRLTRLFKDFVHAFDEADTVILMPVYKVAGREDPPAGGGKDSFALAQEIKERKASVFYAQDFAAAIKALAQNSSGVVVFMSAGDLDSQLRKYLL